MNEQLISLETAKLAKEKGFDEITDLIFDTYNCMPTLEYQIIENFNELKHSDGRNPFISAPTQALLQKWIREVHNIHINITYHGEHSDAHPAFRVLIIPKNGRNIDVISPIEGDYFIFRGYEVSLEEALYQALQLIK